jgi:hypothetical protein
MTGAKWPSGDRHFYAAAISRWDNEGGAPEELPPHSEVSSTSSTVDRAAKRVADTTGKERA